MDDFSLVEAFTYHKPHTDQPARYEEIRSMALQLARVINHSCPDSTEKLVAIRKLREATMWANASIAINE